MLSRCLLSLLINARLLFPQRPPARVDHHCFFRTAGRLSAFGDNSLLALAGALCVLVLSGATARAQVSLTPIVAFDGTLYNYNYSVGNLGSLDLAIISFDVLPQPNAVLNPAAPTGFLINFDPGVGQVSFFEDTDPVTPQTFGPGSTVSGFIFQSSIAPGSSSFTALDVNGNAFMGTTLAPIPEPSTLLLSVIAAASLLFVRMAHRKRQPS